MNSKTPSKASKGLLDASGAPVATPVSKAPVEAPQAAPRASRGPNVAHASLPASIDFPGHFIRVTAAGSGDTIFLNTREIMAMEVNSETSRCQFVFKTGNVLPVIEDADVLVSRMNVDD